MVNILKEYDTYDENLANNGVWVKVKPTLQIKVASFNNSKFTKKLNALRKPHEYKIKHDMMEEKEIEDIMCRAMAGTILLDWKGATNDEGVEVPFTVEEAYKALRVPMFFKMVIELSNLEATFEKAQLEEDKEQLKN